ncbi:MAG: ABC transporter ATP-binding protein [Dehalococcoidia bacterium]
MDDGTVLKVEGLCTQFSTKEGVVKAVNGVDLSLKPATVLGIVGESGSGKTIMALSIINLVPYPGKVVKGKVMFQGRDILTMDQASLRNLRGNEIAMVFQDAMAGLNPILTVGSQIAELLTSHLPVSKKEARQLSVEALRRVDMPDPDRVIDRYTYELSGGMCQRVMLAIAMALDPTVLIADEPTTGLDVTIQADILNRIRRLKDENGAGILLISHDMGVMAQMADEVAVMYGGYIVERAETVTLFQRPLHPYTWALLHSIPRLDSAELTLRSLPGSPPDLLNLGDECPFLPRCNKAMGVCRTKPMPKLVEAEPGHFVACYNLVRHEWD